MEVGTQSGLVQVARCLGMSVKLTTIEGRPRRIRALGDVRYHEMRVKRRVSRSGCAVPEAGREEPDASDVLLAALALTSPARLALEVGKCFTHGRVVRRPGRVRHDGIAQPVDETHRLRRAEGQVEPMNRSLPGVTERL